MAKVLAKFKVKVESKSYQVKGNNVVKNDDRHETKEVEFEITKDTLDFETKEYIYALLAANYNADLNEKVELVLK